MHLGGNLAQLSRYTTLLPVNTCEMERAAKRPLLMNPVYDDST